MFSKELKFGNFTVNEASSTFLIAEAGVNHNGDLDRAFKLVDVACEAQATAVKFQSFITQNIITPYANKADYHIQTTGSDADQSWMELPKSQELTFDEQAKLKAYCDKKNILFLSTPYDTQSLEFLMSIDMPAIKIASCDMNNFELIDAICSYDKPVILSTGMSEISEIRRTLEFFESRRFSDVAILACTGDYPAKSDELNLSSITQYHNEFGTIVGFSDHCVDTSPAYASVGLGSKIYERHFTLSRELPGPDHRASSEPLELKEHFLCIKNLEKSLGDGQKKIEKSEEKNRSLLRRYIVATQDMAAGTKIERHHIMCKRTGGRGISASEFFSLIGKTLKTEKKR